MKTVNFINPVPQKRQREINRWFKSSLLFLIATIAVIVYLQYYQWQRLKKAQLAHEQQTEHVEKLEKVRTKTNNIKTQLEEINDKLAQINQLTHHPENPLPYLTTLNNATGEHVRLTSFAYDNNGLDIAGTAASAHEVTNFIKRLATSERFKNLKLVALQPQSNKRVSFSLKRR